MTRDEIPARLHPDWQAFFLSCSDEELALCELQTECIDEDDSPGTVTVPLFLARRFNNGR